jgi:hypothetical protein
MFVCTLKSVAAGKVCVSLTVQLPEPPVRVEELEVNEEPPL